MKKFLFSIVFISSFVVGFSQEQLTNKNEDNEVNEILDELLNQQSFDDLMASLVNADFLYFSLNYNSDTYFSGREIDVNQYNMTPQISYMNSKGFFASISGVIYSEFIPNWDVTILTVGYGKSFGKNNLFRYFGSVSGYLYSNNDIDGLYNSNVNAGIGIKNKKNTIGSQLSGSYYFGGESTFQIVSRSYANINLVKNKKHSLKFRPQISVISGSQLVNITGVSFENELLNTKSIVEQEVSETKKEFSLIYTQLNFPIQYSYNSFDFEIGYNLNIPFELENETNLNNTGFFNIGLSYLLDL